MSLKESIKELNKSLARLGVMFRSARINERFDKMPHRLSPAEFQYVKNASQRVCKKLSFKTLGEFVLVCKIIISKIEAGVLTWEHVKRRNFPFKKFWLNQ